MVSFKLHIPRRKHGVRGPGGGQEIGKKTQLPRPCAAGSLGRKLLSWSNMTTSKVRAEVSRVLFTDGGTEAQSEPDGDADLWPLCLSEEWQIRYPNPKEVCVFSILLCSRPHSTGWPEGPRVPFRIDSVQEPRGKALQVKFGRAQALDKDTWARDQLSADLPGGALWELAPPALGFKYRSAEPPFSPPRDKLINLPTIP